MRAAEPPGRREASASPALTRSSRLLHPELRKAAASDQGQPLHSAKWWVWDGGLRVWKIVLRIQPDPLHFNPTNAAWVTPPRPNGKGDGYAYLVADGEKVKRLDHKGA